jgi:hypothetical protein
MSGYTGEHRAGRARGQAPAGSPVCLPLSPTRTAVCPMALRIAYLLLAPLVLSGCGDAAGPGRAADIEVVSATRVLYAAGFPAIVFVVANRGTVGVEAVNLEVDARRDGSTVASAATQVSDLSPGEQAESPPAVFAALDSHADYECYRYRVRAYDDRGQAMSDDSSEEVCA